MISEPVGVTVAHDAANPCSQTRLHVSSSSGNGRTKMAAPPPPPRVLSSVVAPDQCIIVPNTNC